MAVYNRLSPELQARIEQDTREHYVNPYAFQDQNIIRRDMGHDAANLWRPAFVRDVEKIMNIPYYNRYSDKTQVFSFYTNDDISRRAFHVQLVSRIARNIGRTLRLNLDLIEAIALGHDIGHTPFGHAGERMLSRLLQAETGRYFNHNVHSARVLDQLIQRNISLQVLDGVLCHNGELEQQEYRPQPLASFTAFDQKVEACYIDEQAIGRLVPSTLEACVVRICDIIAYLGKDRQDAQRLGMLGDTAAFTNAAVGSSNGEIINNLIVNIIENSYGKDYLQMEPDFFDALKTAKKENGKMIYGNSEINAIYDRQIEPMFQAVYDKLLHMAKEHDRNSVLYRHHIKFIHDNNQYQTDKIPYEETEPNQIVVDYIASMTDDYFIDLYHWLFPDGKYEVQYRGYFDDIQ